MYLYMMKVRTMKIVNSFLWHHRTKKLNPKENLTMMVNLQSYYLCILLHELLVVGIHQMSQPRLLGTHLASKLQPAWMITFATHLNEQMDTTN